MNETIKKTEFSILASFLMRSLFIGWTVYSVGHIALQDGPISMLLSLLFSFLPLCLYYLLFTFDSKLNFIALLHKYLGKIGKVITLVLVAFVLLNMGAALWNLANFISSQFLYLTPYLLIASVFMICVLYMCLKGLKTIGRSGIILFIINVILFALPILSLFSEIKIDNLFPILENGWIPVFKGAGISISYNVLPLFLLLIIPKDNVEDNKKLVSSFLKVYLYTFLTLFLVIFFCTTIFGIKLTNLYQYPEFHILKTINIANFFQRVETILSIQWIFDHMMAIVMGLFFIKTSIIQTFPKVQKHEKWILVISALIIIIISQIIFPNNTVVENIGMTLAPILLLIFYLGIPLITYIIIQIRKHKN